MWKSWFLGHDLVWLGLPAMIIFMTAFIIAAIRALRTSADEVNAAASLPLHDEGVEP